MGRTPRQQPGDKEASCAGVAPDQESELLSAGWKRCFAAEGSRLAEAVETYEELGFEVRTVPVAPSASAACAACIQGDGRLRMIYTRRRTEGGG